MRSWSTGTPWDLANPCAAFVGCPDASNAAEDGGPKISWVREVCCVCKPSTTNVRRRGVPTVRSASYSNRHSANSLCPSVARSCNACGRKADGNSSVPISSRKGNTLAGSLEACPVLELLRGFCVFFGGAITLYPPHSRTEVRAYVMFFSSRHEPGPPLVVKVEIPSVPVAPGKLERIFWRDFALCRYSRSVEPR